MRTAACAAWSGRVLIGLVFTLAVCEAISPDYLDGRFFRVTLVTDERFAALRGSSAGSMPECSSNTALGTRMASRRRCCHSSRACAFRAVVSSRRSAFASEALLAIAFCGRSGAARRDFAIRS
jgi:hypothetical protein